MANVDLGLDPVTGDLPRVPTLITGLDLILQRIRLRLNRGQGEWFLDLDAGLPLLAWRTQKPPNLPSISSTIQAEIDSIPGVQRTQNFTATFNDVTRQLTVSGEVVTDAGEVTRVTVLSSRTEPTNAAFFHLLLGGA